MAATERQLSEECAILEEQELTVQNENAKSDIYSNLLAIYILQNDLVNAKFLWKRIPANVKSGIKAAVAFQAKIDLFFLALYRLSPHLESLWKIGQLLWSRDFATVHIALKQEWPKDIERYILPLKERLNERVLNLVSKSYSNIKTEEFSKLIGTSEQEAIQVAHQKNWQIEDNAGFIHPRAPDTDHQQDVSPTISSEQQLACLTDYVSYLEN